MISNNPTLNSESLSALFDKKLAEPCVLVELPKLLTLAIPMGPVFGCWLDVSVPLAGPAAVFVAFAMVNVSCKLTVLYATDLPEISGVTSGVLNTFSTFTVLPTSIGVIAESTFSVVLGLGKSTKVGAFFSIS